MPFLGLSVFPRPFDTYTNVLSFDASLDLGRGTFRSITSYVEDGYQSIPEQVYPFPFDVSERIFTQELLYEFGPEDRVKVGELSRILGFAYENRNQRTDIAGLFRFSSNIETISTALFADLRYGLTDKLTIFGGLRAQQFEDKRFQASTVGPTTAVQNLDDTEIVFLPALGRAYYFDDNKVLSGSVRTGYTPGGSSVSIFTGQPFTYQSEEVTTAEITYRQEHLEGLYDFGVTAFYNEFNDPQLYAELVPGNRASLQVVNQGAGRGYGLEFDGSVQATDRLRLSGSLGLLETEITTAGALTPMIKGNSFGQDPNLTLSLGHIRIAPATPPGCPKRARSPGPSPWKPW